MVHQVSVQRRLFFRAIQILIWILMIDCAPASAAAVFGVESSSQEGRQWWIVTLRGKIEPGDAKRLQAFLQQRVPPEFGTTTTDDWLNVTISLDSPGGDFAEGLKIANFIYDAGMATLVQNGSTCASACALAFLGGAAPHEVGVNVDRSLEVGGTLKFHAPYVNTRKVETELAELVRQLTDVNIELLVAMTSKFSVPPNLVQTLLKNDKEQGLYTVETVEALVGLGVNVKGLYQPRSLTLEMATNLCVNAHADGRSPWDIEFEHSRSLQTASKFLHVSNGESSEEIAIPVSLSLEEETSPTYCIVRHSKDDGSFDCVSITSDMDFYAIKSEKELVEFPGKGCGYVASPSALLIVPRATKLEDYRSVVQKMEARGKSIFDLAAYPSTTSSSKTVKPTGTSGSSRGFICNDQAEFANMREGPHGTNFPVVAELANNTGVKVLEETANSETGHLWLKISAKGKEGFVDKDLVSAKKCAQSTAAALQPAADFKPGKAVICNSEASFANMRSGPGPQKDLVMALDNQTAVKKLAATVNEETQHPWLKIQAKGKTGYVDAEKVAASCDMDP